MKPAASYFRLEIIARTQAEGAQRGHWLRRGTGVSKDEMSPNVKRRQDPPPRSALVSGLHVAKSLAHAKCRIAQAMQELAGEPQAAYGHLEGPAVGHFSTWRVSGKQFRHPAGRHCELQRSRRCPLLTGNIACR
jgi:hypothetical protein